VVVKGREIERFGKRVFGAVLERVEERALERAKGRVSCREKDHDTCSPA